MPNLGVSACGASRINPGVLVRQHRDVFLFVLPSASGQWYGRLGFPGGFESTANSCEKPGSLPSVTGAPSTPIKDGREISRQSLHRQVKMQCGSWSYHLFKTDTQSAPEEAPSQLKPARHGGAIQLISRLGRASPVEAAVSHGLDHLRRLEAARPPLTELQGRGAPFHSPPRGLALPSPSLQPFLSHCKHLSVELLFKSRQQCPNPHPGPSGIFSMTIFQLAQLLSDLVETPMGSAYQGIGVPFTFLVFLCDLIFIFILINRIASLI